MSDPELKMSQTGKREDPSAQEVPEVDLPESYAFVMNVKALRDSVGIHLIEGHELRRATVEDRGNQTDA